MYMASFTERICENTPIKKLEFSFKHEIITISKYVNNKTFFEPFVIWSSFIK